MGRLFLLFTVVPLIELLLLVELAQRMGFWPTVALVLLTGFLGATLARGEGLRMLRGFQRALTEGRVPEDGAISAVLLLVGAVLLVTPGVLTDLCGLLLLVPTTRRMLATAIAARMERDVASGHVRVVHSRVWTAGDPPPPDSPRHIDGRRVIDVEARVIDSSGPRHS